MRRYPWNDVLDDDRLVSRHSTAAHRAGQAPALLMIDLYARVFGDGPQPLADAMERFPWSCGLSAWEALEPLEKVLATARAHDPSSTVGTATDQ